MASRPSSGLVWLVRTPASDGTLAWPRQPGLRQLGVLEDVQNPGDALPSQQNFVAEPFRGMEAVFLCLTLQAVGRGVDTFWRGETNQSTMLGNMPAGPCDAPVDGGHRASQHEVKWLSRFPLLGARVYRAH